MWFVKSVDLDECFILVAKAFQMGLLGDSVKVPPMRTAAVQPIIIYTNDFRDEDDVLRVALNLRQYASIEKTLAYKPDIFTLSDDGIYGGNSLPASIYNLKVGESKLIKTTNGSKKYGSNKKAISSKNAVATDKSALLSDVEIAIECVYNEYPHLRN